MRQCNTCSAKRWGSLTVMLGVAACCANAHGQPQTNWLNVRDFGASGSKFETTAATAVSSNQVTVADVGDFQVGQGVMISKCNIHYNRKSLFGPRAKRAANRPLEDEVEVRGYDGTGGSWVVYMLDVAPAHPTIFRWTDDFGRTWHEDVPITYEWQPLSSGTEVRFHQFDWQDGYTAIISARDQLVTSIEKIEGNVLTLRDPANRVVSDAVVRHNDTSAMQAAIDRAIAEKKNVYIPIGNYCLSGTLAVNNATAIVIEGANAVDTVLDIGEGEGACFSLRDGIEVTLRSMSMVGHSGFEDRDQAGVMRTRGGTSVWGFYFKRCNAVGISNTERVFVENCHARKMSAECFYSSGRSRSGTHEPTQYTKAITYLRCSVEDCARNAFNNNDMAENTSILFCRVRDVGGCTWEGASRFVRFIGNYVRNGGTVAMGNIRSRSETYEQLGSGQHIIADNVFESACPYGGCMIRAAACATQVIVRNNLFVNFNSSAVHISGDTGSTDLPASTALITGNICDMTAIGEEPRARTAINVTASDVMVTNNQIYVRGDHDPLLTGLCVRDDALNLTIHDNLFRSCGTAISAERMGGKVGETLDAKTFLRGSWRNLPPLMHRKSHRYRGWNVVWLKNETPDGTSVIEQFDPETCQFTLREPRELKTGDMFEMFPPGGANWNIHDNMITDCAKPIVLDCYGSESSLLRGNVIARGNVAGVKAAIEVGGRFNLIGNHVVGFDEPEATALSLAADPLGRTPHNLYCRNIFEHCARIVPEDQKVLWDGAKPEGNVYIECSEGDSAKPVDSP